MNKEDQYWFWLIRAISETETNTMLHLYDKKLDILFSLLIIDETVKPFFRSSSLQEHSIANKMNTEVNKYSDKDPDIILLPRISVEDKISFIKDFSNTYSDETLKGLLIKNWDKSLSTIRDMIKIYSKKISFEYDLKLGEFYLNKIRFMYTPLGISENTLMLW